MLSVIIPTYNEVQAMQRLLMALAPAAVDGLVREVIAADAGSTDQTLELADDAGVDVVSGGLVTAAAKARSDWVLVLPATIELREGWAARLSIHLAGGPRPALITGEGLWFRAKPRGILISKVNLLKSNETRDVPVLVKTLGRGVARL